MSVEAAAHDRAKYLLTIKRNERSPSREIAAHNQRNVQAGAMTQPDTPSIAAQMPIVDAHHHFWDLQRNYYPWLCHSNLPGQPLGRRMPRYLEPQLSLPQIKSGRTVLSKYHVRTYL